MVDEGNYFVINRARQYGKTTLLWALRDYLKEEYITAFVSFQRLSAADFEDEGAFTEAFADLFLQALDYNGKAGNGMDRDAFFPLEQIAEGDQKKRKLRILI